MMSWSFDVLTGENFFYRDDDSSWKVWIGADKCLCTVVRTRSEMLKSLYDKVLTHLMSLFREREEIVKMEVFSVLKDLLCDILRQSQVHNNDVDDTMETGGVSKIINTIKCDEYSCGLKKYR